MCSCYNTRRHLNGSISHGEVDDLSSCWSFCLSMKLFAKQPPNPNCFACWIAYDFISRIFTVCSLKERDTNGFSTFCFNSIHYQNAINIVWPLFKISKEKCYFTVLFFTIHSHATHYYYQFVDTGFSQSLTLLNFFIFWSRADRKKSYSSF